MDNKFNSGASGGDLNMGFGLRSPFIMPDGVANPLYKSFGGGLTHGVNWDTGVNWVDEGGSHGENPLGGVPMGVDDQGIPNLVEEGEAIWNGDYVFSKRMKVPKKLAKKYGLGGDITFADAIKKLTKDSEERPLSMIDRDTNDHILGEFADVQEERRMAKAQRAMEREQQLQEDFMTGFQYGLGGHLSPFGIVPDSDNISPFEKAEQQFANGGGIHIDPSKRGTFKAQASKMGMGVQEAANHILANKENYSPAMVKKAVFAHNFAKAYGGDLFTNPFAYGGEMGNIFEGEGDRPNSFTWGTDFSSAPWVRNMQRLTSNPKPYLTFEELQAIQKAREAAKKYQEAVKQQRAQEVASNKGRSNGRKARATSTPRNTDAANAAALSAAIGPTGLNLYDWYRNGSDGYSTPTGFKVGENGKAYDYTDEYTTLVKSKTADDIRKWARKRGWKEGMTNFDDITDPSLKSFLKKGNKLENLKDDQWHTGALDGKYGFMHHVANDMLQNPQTPQEESKTAAPATTRGTILLDEDGKLTPIDAATEDMIFEQEMPGEYGNVQIYKRKPKEAAADTTKPVAEKVDNTTGNGKFKPRPTWMRQMPIWMSGLAALRGELTPPDYTNADAILNAAYAAGRPVSVGTEYVGDYRVRDPFDERYLMNIINQNAAATRENLMNFSGGNRAVAMSGMSNNDLTRQMALAEAARQAYLANRADDVQVSDFNYRTNKGNADAQNTRNLALAQLNSGRQNAMLSGVAQGARLRQAIKDQRDAANSANWTAFAQNMGDWGKENGYYNMLGGLNDEGVLKYFFGDDWTTKFNNNSMG